MNIFKFKKKNVVDFDCLIYHLMINLLMVREYLANYSSSVKNGVIISSVVLFRKLNLRINKCLYSCLIECEVKNMWCIGTIVPLMK